jgi:hypothetical protein
VAGRATGHIDRIGLIRTDRHRAIDLAAGIGEINERRRVVHIPADHRIALITGRQRTGTRWHHDIIEMRRTPRDIDRWFRRVVGLNADIVLRCGNAGTVVRRDVEVADLMTVAADVDHRHTGSLRTVERDAVQLAVMKAALVADDGG